MSDVKIEKILGFDKVRKIISDRCSTEYGAARAAAEDFCTDEKEIRRRLLLTDEMRLIVMFEESFPSNGYIDATSFLRTLSKAGANIDVVSLAKLRTMLETLQKISDFFVDIKDGVYPALKKMTSAIVLYPEVLHKVDSILDKYGNVKDTASDALYEIRSAIKEKEGTVSKRMASILKSAQASGFVEQDASIVMRDGKMLLPVSSANKRKVSGFVYDESSSGKTTFIEPAEIVELTNEISELRFSENREIARILSEFSDWVRPYVPDLLKGAECIGELDFIIAKAQTALDFVAGMPIISDAGEVILRKARHPLLERALRKEGRDIVPLSITLTPQKHIVLISGPNAGGKSVCLKTVGLLQYMFQYGMLIPTSETSEMTVFDRVMADIGDGQSIENDLSTYSSFLASMKEMLAVADKKTLVLIDEFGSGTEPTAGGAIAEAILSQFDKAGVYGVITTHYTNLKLYASAPDSGVLNAAMQFDDKNIVPLFKLEPGLPGNSFAFALARKMGLPEEVVKDAETRAGEEFVGIERNLRKIARNRKALDEKLQKIRNTDKTLENITGRYQKELESISSMKKEILDNARKEAEEIIKGANREVERTIRTIREKQAAKEETRKAREGLQNFVSALVSSKEKNEREREDYIEEKLRKVSERQQRQQQRRLRHTTPEELQKIVQETEREKKIAAFRSGPLKVGEKVRIKDNGMAGEVALVSDKAVTVIVGSIKTKLPLSRVERISSNEYKDAVRAARPQTQSVPQDSSLSERKLNFKMELDVRGQRTAEAIENVMHYIDDAIMLNVHSVRIIHGKGTGALREEIQKFLKSTPGVISAKDESVQLGGSGVTVVTFDN